MNISWGNWDVRVYAARSWVYLAPRFAAQHPVIIDHIEAVVNDPAPAVRLQAAQNLHVVSVAAPERMWAMIETLAARETDTHVLSACISQSMRRFSHSEPERCEAVLGTVKARFADGITNHEESRDLIQESFGGWVAQLHVAQGRAIPRNWLEEWVTDPERNASSLNSFISSLRSIIFKRYRFDADAEARAMSSRAQDALALILAEAIRISSEAHSVLMSGADDPEKEAARKRYGGAEKVVLHAMNQLYFGSGAFRSDNNAAPGLPSTEAKARFLADYANELDLIARAHEPATLHHLIELYEFLIPGNPVTVFESIYAVLVGRGEEEGYHYESLGKDATVRIIRRYIADHRSIFENEDHRAKLIAILQLFSDGGWPDALKLLYDLPDLLR